MSIWVIGDLHLAFGAPEKSMEVFGPAWENYANRLEENWKKVIQSDDLVLIPGDICWSQTLEKALIDLNWIDALPGTKVILKGNHDYWWPSNKKLKESLPPSIHFVHKNVFNWGDVTIGGSRLWDTDEYSFGEFIEFRENPLAKEKVFDLELQQKTFNKELERLEFSLNQLSETASLRICMTHYPPISADLKDSKTSKILENYGIDICVFGHLHNVRKGPQLFGKKNNIDYLFTSADYLNFEPIKIKYEK